MSKANENQKRNLSKAEWLRWAQDRSLPENPPYEDLFSRRAVKGLLYLENGQEARQALQNLETQIEKRVAPRSNRLRRIPPRLLQFAAAILLLLLPLTIVWFDAQPTPSQTAFEQHFEIIPSNIPVTGSTREEKAGESPSLKQQAVLEYENHLFASANDKFEQYLETAPSDMAMRFYYGISLLAEEKPGRAVDQFQQVYQQSTVEPYRIPAQWYLGMAHLKLDQQAEAVSHLRSLANQIKSFYYREKAEAVLRDLEPQGPSGR